MKVRLLCLFAAVPLFACGGSQSQPATTTAAEVGDETPGVIDPGHPPASDGRYAVTLHRPVAVGDRVHFVGTGTEDVMSGYQGAEPHAQRLFVELEGDVFVEAETHGHATVSIVTITRFVAGPAADAMTEQLAAGTVLRVQHGADDDRVTQDGAAVDEAVEKAFTVIFPTGLREVDLDATFGSQEPRAVGEFWDIDAAAAAASLPDGFNVPESGVSGRSTLSSVSEDQMNVMTEVAFENPQMPSAPENAEVTESTMVVRTALCLPLDVSRDACGESYEVNLRFVMVVPDAQAPIVVVMEGRHTLEFSPSQVSPTQ